MPLTHPADGHREFERLFNSGDLEAILSLYDPAAVLVLPEGEVIGHDAIRSAIARRLALGGKMRIQTLSAILATDTALTSASWRLVASDGHTIVQAESAEVWRKHPSAGWLATIDCPYGPG